MYTKFDSDITNLELSSASSPKHLAYYVQSPSHDDGEKSSSAALTHTTPTPRSYNTPTESPSHTSYVSRISSGRGSRWKGWRRNHGGRYRWRLADKEEDNEIYVDDRGISVAKCRVILLVLGILAVFFFICLVLLWASLPFSPIIYVKGMKVYNFYYGEGLDNSGVPTKILNFRSSVEITTHNPSTFFGIHITSSTFNLIYSDQLILATAQMKNYYQPKQSNHTSKVDLVGSKVPLYGAGTYFVASDNKNGVPVKLEFQIHSQGNIVGKLVRSRHRKHVSCFFLITSYNATFVKFNNETCKYLTI